MDKKTVFITGASSGIGKGLVYRFAQDGYQVAAAARRIDLLNNIAKDLNKENKLVLPISCDVTKKSEVLKAVQVCHEQLGQIDIFIANAGQSISSPGEEFSAEIYEELYKTNVFGVIFGFEAVIPDMIKRKSGQLVCISSLAGYRGLPQSGAYSSSKAAVAALTESLRIDLKEFNIKVSLINPGFIKTPMTDRNSYYMPFLMGTQRGVDKIYRAIMRQKSVYAFPWQLALLVRLLRLFPARIYDFVLRNRKNIKKS
ncbi:SDR family NAD(P)-dependent oxidoreductase [Candidatus Margulisiibacteriota bacterium]